MQNGSYKLTGTIRIYRFPENSPDAKTVNLMIHAGNNDEGWADVKIELSASDFAQLLLRGFPRCEVEINLSDEQRILMA